VLTALVGAVGALASSSVFAHDAYHGHPSAGVYRPSYGPAPQVVVVEPPPVYVQSAPRRRYGHAHAASGCAAPAWEPWVRYMPGQVVWQAGSLWVASSLSASVWNKNSPPEWTPSYWAPAVCR
ncbi:MAG TPA: hypothetical protein VLJ86_05535, partial [Ramlibacter sp.]|nr:hypothetical protein [Ramlibacter sp.]